MNDTTEPRSEEAKQLLQRFEKAITKLINRHTTYPITLPLEIGEDNGTLTIHKPDENGDMLVEIEHIGKVIKIHGKIDAP